MSGGSMDYLYLKVQDVADSEALKTTPKRRLFAEHLQRVANALRAIEWVDSGDSSPGTEEEAIREVLRVWQPKK